MFNVHVSFRHSADVGWLVLLSLFVYDVRKIDIVIYSGEFWRVLLSTLFFCTSEGANHVGSRGDFDDVLWLIKGGL